MPTEDSTAEPVWQSAIALLDDITRRTEAGAVVRAAYRAGLLAQLVSPSSLGDLAASVAANEARLRAVLDVLCSLEIVDVVDGTWSLTPAWIAMVTGESPADLSGYLEAPTVRMSQFERSLIGGDDYWQLPADERMMIARGVSFNPSSPVMAMMLRRELGILDGVIPALEAGGRVLELGCGVGSRLTALALLFPQAHGIGLELDDQLVAFGRARADALGVSDRITYVTGDATEYEAAEPCDLVNWSQFFFPTATRAPALRTAWNSLRPGGWVTTPVIWADEQASVDDDLAQDRALEGLNLNMWGVPARTTSEVQAELDAAGFVDIRVDDMAYIHHVRGRRPLK